LAFGGSRTYHRIACAIEDAGFEIRDCIMYLYGSGFPKSMDVAKSLEGKLTLGSSNTKDFKKLNGEQITKGNWGYAKMQLEQGYRNKNYDTEAESETYLGKLKPTTDLAKKWQGWGTNLKPAYEPIIVARKPFEGSLVNNIIQNGVGALNIDECRIEFENTQNPATNPLFRKLGEYKLPEKGQLSNGTIPFSSSKNDVNELGRFPANVITDGSEEVQSGFPETKSNGGNYSMKDFSQFKGSMMSFTNQKQESQKSRIVSDKKLPIDSGNACRYFYCAKTTTKDREEGLIGFEKQQTTDGSIRSNEKTARAYGANSGLRKNIHPTVKPTTLMQYLIRLVSPKGSVILDPFMGSGSTGKAVMFENNERNANYKFIGIELTKEYLPICEARIKWASEPNMIVIENTKENKVEKYRQTTLFDFLE